MNAAVPNPNAKPWYELAGIIEPGFVSKQFDDLWIDTLKDAEIRANISAMMCPAFRMPKPERVIYNRPATVLPLLTRRRKI